MDQKLTRSDDSDVCFALCWTLVDIPGIVLEVNGPIILFTFAILDLELEDTVYLYAQAGEPRRTR